MESIRILNHDFEQDPQTEQNKKQHTPDGWVLASGRAYVENPSPRSSYYNLPEFDDKLSNQGVSGTMAGPNIATIEGPESPGELYQILDKTLEPNQVYVLQVSLGHRTFDSDPKLKSSPVTIQIRAGDTVIASASTPTDGGTWDDTGSLKDDIWADLTAIGASNNFLRAHGQKLSIHIIKEKAGDYIDFDNVRLQCRSLESNTIDLKSGLFAYYPFENDLKNLCSNTSKEATAVNSPKYGQAEGALGQCLSVQGGNNDHIQLPISYGSGSTDLGTSFSLGLWYKMNIPIKSKNASNRYFVVEGSTGYALSYGLRNKNLGNSSYFDGQTYSISSSADNDNYLDIPDAGKDGWHHLLLVFSSETDQTSIRTYVDGEFRGQLQLATNKVSDKAINIGSSRTTITNRGFDGCIDDVAVWKRSLNSSEARALFEMGLNKQLLLP